MKTILTALAVSLISSSLANAQLNDGVYALTGISCKNGSAEVGFTTNMASAVGITFLSLNQGKARLTIKMGNQCEVSYSGSYTVSGNSLNVSKMDGSATAQCGAGEVPSTEAETSTFVSSGDNLTISEVSDGTNCQKGNTITSVYKKVL